MRPAVFAFAALLAATAALAPSAVRAQNPVQIGAPLTGETVLNRDVEVRIAPNENGRIVMTLDKGKPLNALGTPRGTSWTQVAVGGQPIGYVPADSLDPALAVRPLQLPAPPRRAPGAGPAGYISPTAAAALAPKAAWDRAQSPQAKGYVLLLDDVQGPPPKDPKKPKGPALRRGDVAGLLDVAGDQARLIAPGGARVEAPLSKMMGVMSGYPLPGQSPLGVGPIYAARLGEYIDYAEGRRAWDVFVRGPAGGEFRDRPPMVWPMLRGDTLTYQMGIGPFSAGELDNICPTLAQRGFACAIIELARL
jgi:hypothetical protein